jgi:hypothetical protein
MTMMLAIPIAHQQRDSAEAKQQRGELALAAARASSASEGRLMSTPDES